jgi:hypothetical protein
VTATSNPAIVGTLRCTATCSLDLLGCRRITTDAGFGGRGGAGGTFGFGGTGGTGGSAAGAGTGGTVGLSPPVPCGAESCEDPLTGAAPSLIAALKQGGSYPSACCLDATTSTCGTQFPAGPCQPLPARDPTCPSGDSSLPLGSTFPCCIVGQCGLSLFGTPCMSLADLQGIVTTPPVACGSLGTGGFGPQP